MYDMHIALAVSTYANSNCSVYDAGFVFTATKLSSFFTVPAKSEFVY
jgi:hypothetical protein